MALAALVLAGAPAGAMGAATVVDGLSGDPLERGAALALPSVYRIDVRVVLDALLTADGRRVALPPVARSFPELGTAFGAAPGGWVVSAAHVASPAGASLATAAYQRKLAAENRAHSGAAARAWVARTGARPTGVRVVSRRLRQADAGGGAQGSRTFTPTDLRVDRASDLALMRIPDRHAPALELDESVSIDTPVTTIGFGTGSAFGSRERGMLEPALRRGKLGRTGLVGDPTDRTGRAPRRRAVQVTTGVQPGDSGGPAVDARGRVRGVVVKYNDGGGVIERASEVRMLLRAAGADARPDVTAQRFRQAMDRYWQLDLDAAAGGFEATLAQYPGHTLAPVMLGRIERIEAAEPRIASEGGRPRAFLLALGVASAAAAVACAVALVRGRRPADPPAERPRLPVGRRR